MTANRIIAHVFLQPSLQLVNEAAIEQLVADHPYFSAARLLLARKVYQQTGDLQHPAVKKALLYADQHHYAYQLIAEEQVLQVVENRVANIIPEDTLPAEAPPGSPENGALASAIADTLPITEDEAIPQDTHHVFEAVTPETENIALESIEEEIIAAIAAEEMMEVPVYVQRAPIEVAELPEPEEEMPASFHQEAVELETPANLHTEAVPEPTAAPRNFHTEAANTPEPATATAVADFEPDTATHTLPADVLPPVVTAPQAEEAEADAPGPIKIFPMAAAEEETELVFQPLYTDDYFAYKRLKNPEDADDLNEQGAAEMKSFTSWLRQMKDNFAGKTNKDWYHQQLHRLYEDDEEPEVSETVEKMAMDSIVFNNDIVSETLAEIWVRQQQYGNAIKIYQKLSLLNPDKNAYFAQKILDLKSKTDKNKQ